jgi:hypothetical protein
MTSLLHWPLSSGSLKRLGGPTPDETILRVATVMAAAEPSAAIFGENVGDWMGCTGEARLLQGIGHLIPLNERQLKRQRSLHAGGRGNVVFFGRLVMVLRKGEVLLAQTRRMRWARFLLCTVLGGSLWALGLSSRLAWVSAQQSGWSRVALVHGCDLRKDGQSARSGGLMTGVSASASWSRGTTKVATTSTVVVMQHMVGPLPSPPREHPCLQTVGYCLQTLPLEPCSHFPHLKRVCLLQLLWHATPRILRAEMACLLSATWCTSSEGESGIDT